MFESLDEHMKHDQESETTPRERLLKWVTIIVVSVLLFGGLYIGLRTFQFTN